MTTPRSRANDDPNSLVLQHLRLDNKIAIVTGASGGIGRGCSIALAAAGVSEVILIDRFEADLQDVAQQVEQFGAQGIPFVCDITKDETYRDAVRDWNADILINNAGTNEPEYFLEVTPNSYDRIFDLNCRGTFFFTQCIVRDMVERRRPGSIVNVASQMGLVGAAKRTAYCASKHAIVGFTKALAIELANHSIRVNSIAPTFILTPLTQPFFADATFRQQVEASIPMGRLGRVEEVTAAVVFLASDAASLITGSCLTIDGGWTAQ